MGKTLPPLSEQLPELPQLLYGALRTAEELQRLRADIARSGQRTLEGLGAAAAMVAGALLCRVDANPLVDPQTLATAGCALVVAGLVGLVWAWVRHQG